MPRRVNGVIFISKGHEMAKNKETIIRLAKYPNHKKNVLC